MRSLATLIAAFLFSFIGGTAVAGTYAHWSDNEPNFPRGYAYIQDQTPSQWPVLTAAVNWDQAPKLDLVYLSGSCGAGNRCIPIIANGIGPNGCAGTVGITSPTTSGVHLTSASSRVDEDCSGLGAAARRELVCHEMGHAIGLTDRGAGAASCMRTATGLGGQVAGSPADFTDLNTAYSHDS
jgi:hypothetical protein